MTAGPSERLLKCPPFVEALSIQSDVLREFHDRSIRVLGGICELAPWDDSVASMERNLFSCLFIAAQRGVGLPRNQLRLYALLSQCMRAWVTACDNLLDDEFKAVIPMMLPKGGGRFASVLTIMAADRVLFELLDEEVAAGNLSRGEATAISRLTLKILAPSGLQEHEEELGAKAVLEPQELLDRIHLLKTGLLFEAPVAVAEAAGRVDMSKAPVARAGLSLFGLACQILDDIVDVDDDIPRQRHNFVLSTAVHSRCISGRPVAREDVALEELDLEAASEASMMRAMALFEESRDRLAVGGLIFQDRDWRDLLLAVSERIKAPARLMAAIGARG
ncbi:MAG TPA: polyprenyl synthetase family protein [Candidatus Brocadiia bacterium]|nr:polyprenyl synthetase family protein [Candidatus Brocadiia bacterium]